MTQGLVLDVVVEEVDSGLNYENIAPGETALRIKSFMIPYAYPRIQPVLVTGVFFLTTTICITIPAWKLLIIILCLIVFLLYRAGAQQSVARGARCRGTRVRDRACDGASFDARSGPVRCRPVPRSRDKV